MMTPNILGIFLVLAAYCFVKSYASSRCYCTCSNNNPLLQGWETPSNQGRTGDDSSLIDPKGSQSFSRIGDGESGVPEDGGRKEGVHGVIRGGDYERQGVQDEGRRRGRVDGDMRGSISDGRSSVKKDEGKMAGFHGVTRAQNYKHSDLQHETGRRQGRVNGIMQGSTSDGRSSVKKDEGKMAGFHGVTRGQIYKQSDLQHEGRRQGRVDGVMRGSTSDGRSSVKKEEGKMAGFHGVTRGQNYKQSDLQDEGRWQGRVDGVMRVNHFDRESGVQDAQRKQGEHRGRLLERIDDESRPYYSSYKLKEEKPELRIDRGGSRYYYKLETDWMAKLDGYMNLIDLTIPGTHDTMAFRLYYAANLIWRGFGETQYADIVEQMHGGIRAFDIRCGWSGDTIVSRSYWKEEWFEGNVSAAEFKNEWEPSSYGVRTSDVVIHHGPFPLLGPGVNKGKHVVVNLRHVFHFVTKFLDQHPKEAILMRIQIEKIDNEIPLDNPRQYTVNEAKLKKAIVKELFLHEKYLWKTADKSSRHFFPNLGNIRKKIVLLKDSGIKGIKGIKELKEYGLDWGHLIKFEPLPKRTVEAQFKKYQWKHNFQVPCENATGPKFELSKDSCVLCDSSRNHTVSNIEHLLSEFKNMEDHTTNPMACSFYTEKGIKIQDDWKDIPQEYKATYVDDFLNEANDDSLGEVLYLNMLSYTSGWKYQETNAQFLNDKIIMKFNENFYKYRKFGVLFMDYPPAQLITSIIDLNYRDPEKKSRIIKIYDYVGYQWDDGYYSKLITLRDKHYCFSFHTSQGNFNGYVSSIEFIGNTSRECVTLYTDEICRATGKGQYMLKITNPCKKNLGECKDSTGEEVSWDNKAYSVSMCEYQRLDNYKTFKDTTVTTSEFRDYGDAK